MSIQEYKGEHEGTIMEVGVKEAAEILDVSEKTIYRWIAAERLPFFKVGSQYRFSRSMLNKWLAANSCSSVGAVEPEVCHKARFNLTDAVRNGGIYYRIEGSDIDSVLEQMVNQAPLPESVNRQALTSILIDRERLSSTGIGDGVAIPHSRSPVIFELPNPILTVNFLENPIEYNAIDNKPVELAFLLLSSSSRAHLQLLSRLSYALRTSNFMASMKSVPSRETIMAELAIIDDILK